MRRHAFLLLIGLPLLAASAPVPPPAGPLSAAVRQAQADQAAADAAARHFEQVADGAKDKAARQQARASAAAQAVEAAEARISAASARLQLIAAATERQGNLLRREQQPIAALLSGLAMMADRPPLLAIADRGGADDLVKVRVLLDSTLPVIRSRTAALSSQLAAQRRLEQDAIAGRQELQRGRADLIVRREKFAALETQAIESFTSARGQALAAGDTALAAGENVAQLRGAEASGRSAAAIAGQLARIDPAPARPIAPDGRMAMPLPYRLPAAAPVSEGLGAVNAHGVRARGLTLATTRGAPLIVPAAGSIRFSGPYRSHDGVVIIDHGNGWMSLIVGVASPLQAGDRVALGDPLGRALGPVAVELSQNGRRVSPALIAGSSQSLSNGRKGS